MANKKATTKTQSTESGNEEFVSKSDRLSYQEWDVKITMVKEAGKEKAVPVYEKLKLKRSNVTISEEQANILNDGVLYGSNNYAVMYFLPE